jgi:hypothetical protein
MPFLRRNRRPPWLLRLGMFGYDVLSLDKSLPRHRILDPRATQRLVEPAHPRRLDQVVALDGGIEEAGRHGRLGVEALGQGDDAGLTFHFRWLPISADLHLFGRPHPVVADLAIEEV